MSVRFSEFEFSVTRGQNALEVICFSLISKLNFGVITTLYFSNFRSVKVAYSKESSYKDIPSMQYRTLFLNQIGPEYGNECFCTNQINKAITRSNGCLYRGALDVSTCLSKLIYLIYFY